MATVTDVKHKMLDKLASMDLTHMSLMEVSQYVSILRTLADIGDDSPYNTLMQELRAKLAEMNQPKSDDIPAFGLSTGGE